MENSIREMQAIQDPMTSTCLRQNHTQPRLNNPLQKYQFIKQVHSKGFPKFLWYRSPSNILSFFLRSDCIHSLNTNFYILQKLTVGKSHSIKTNFAYIDYLIISLERQLCLLPLLLFFICLKTVSLAS